MGAELGRQGIGQGDSRQSAWEAEEVTKERGKMDRPTVRETEQLRVAAMLQRDADDREADRLRAIAVAQVENGEFVNLDDTVMPPTREQLSKGDFVPYTPRGEEGTVRSVRTVRRRITSQLVILHSRGVLDDDQLSACKWYRDRYEAAQMEPAAGVGGYGASVRGDPVYGHLPSTEWAAEARADFRWAQAFIPDDVRAMFNLVILDDVPIQEAARKGRCRFANASAAVRRGSLHLHGGVHCRLLSAVENPKNRSSFQVSD